MNTVASAVRRRRRLVTMLGRRTPHQNKVLEIHETFRRELAEVPVNGAASFLLHYFCCEASARVIVAARSGKTPRKGLEQSEVGLSAIRAAMKQYAIDLEHDLLTRVFGENHSAAYHSISARRLRDQIVHSFSLLAIKEVAARSTQLL